MKLSHLSPHWSCSLRVHTPPHHAVSAGHKHCSGHVLKSSPPTRQVTFAADSGSHYPPLSPEMCLNLYPTYHCWGMCTSAIQHIAQKKHMLQKNPKQTQSTTSVFVFLGFFGVGLGFSSPLFSCVCRCKALPHIPCSGLKCSGCSCLSHPLGETRPCSEGRRWDVSPCLSHPSPHSFTTAQRHALS